MTDVAATPDADTQLVTAALDELLAAHDPKSESFEEFRGHQFDAGLAWVHFEKEIGRAHV